MCLDYKKAREIPLTVNSLGESYTDGKQIVVSLLHSFLDPKYSETYWMVVMKALVAHECQHINSSSIKRAAKMADEFASFMQSTYGFNQTIGKNLAFEMFNIIEDGRIENIIVDRMPGMKINFLILNGEIRSQGRIDERAKDGDSKTEFMHFRNQVLSYAKSGGNLPGVEVYKNTRLEREFESIREDIDAGVRAYSCGDCCKIVRNLLHKAAPYLNDLLKEDSDFVNALQNMIQRMDFDTEPSDEEYNEAGKAGSAPLQILKREKEPSNENKGENDSSNAKESDSPEKKMERSGGEASPEQAEEENGDSSKADGQSESNQNNQGGQPLENPTNRNHREKGTAKKDAIEQGSEHHERADSDFSGGFSDVELQKRGYTSEELQKAAQIVQREMEKAEKGNPISDVKSGVNSDFVARIAENTGVAIKNIRFLVARNSCRRSLP